MSRRRQVSFLATLNAKGFTAAMKQMEGRMMSFSRKMESVGKSFSTMITAPSLAAGGASVKMAGDFQESMSRIEGLVGLARSEVQGMRSDVLALSGTTARSPQELADAMFFVTSAGIRGSEAMEVLEMSAKAASAGLGETKNIADLVTSAINAYGAENLSASQATDTLVAAVREGKAEASELAGSLGQVLPIASEMGVSFDQVGASIAAMTRTGTDAGTASTQLRQILTSLLKPTSGAEKALADMGTSASELRQSLRDDGLVSVLGFLRDQMEDNEDAMSQVFGNVRALSGALDIMGNNADSNIGIFNRMRDSTGSLDAAFESAANTTNFKFNEALSNLKAAGVELGTLLLPVVNKIIGVFNDLISSFRGLGEETQKNIIMWTGLAAAVGPALIVFAKLIPVLKGVAVAVAGILSPLGLKIALLAAVAASVVFVIANFDRLRSEVARVMAHVSNYVVAGVSRAISSLDSLISWIPGVTSPLSGVAASLQMFVSEIPDRSDAAPIVGFSEIIGNAIDNVRSKLDGVRGRLFSTSVDGTVEEGDDSTVERFKGIEKFARMSGQSVEFLNQSLKRVEVTGTETYDRIAQSADRYIAVQQYANGIANQFVNSFGQGMANVIVQGENLIDTLKNIGKLLASAAIQKGLQMLLMGSTGGVASGFFGGGGLLGSLFGSITSVNDALITSGGDVVKFHPDDNILAMKDFSGLGGGQNVHVTVSGALQGETIFLSNARGGDRWAR